MKVASPSIPQLFEGLTVPEWMNDAECIGADPELFFKRGKAREALRYCHDCPVIQECRDWAQLHHAFGVFGGRVKLNLTTEPEPEQMQPPPLPNVDFRTEKQKRNQKVRNRATRLRNKNDPAKQVDPAEREAKNRAQRERRKNDPAFRARKDAYSARSRAKRKAAQ